MVILTTGYTGLWWGWIWAGCCLWARAGQRTARSITSVPLPEGLSVGSLSAHLHPLCSWVLPVQVQPMAGSLALLCPTTCFACSGQKTHKSHQDLTSAEHRSIGAYFRSLYRSRVIVISRNVSPISIFSSNFLTPACMKQSLILLAIVSRCTRLRTGPAARPSPASIAQLVLCARGGDAVAADVNPRDWHPARDSVH